MQRRTSRGSALLVSLLAVLLWAGSAHAEDVGFPGRAWDSAGRGTLAAGGIHSLAVDAEGTVWAWGNNQDGKLGDGTSQDRPTPVPVLGLSGVVAVAAGNSHSLALLGDGTVWGWGANWVGQLGMGWDVRESYLPVPIPGLTDVVAIASKDYHSLALRRDGTVWGWGYNAFGQLGDGGFNIPVPVQIPGLTDVVAIATGYMHSLALRRDGTVWAWGDNWSGQLGDGTSYTSRTTPAQVVDLTDVVAVSAGFMHSLALRRDGTVWAWGNNGAGELGIVMADPWGAPISERPVQVPGLRNVVALSSGVQDSQALQQDGTVWAWGFGVNLGNGGTTLMQFTPTQVRDLTGAVAISTGGEHVLALRRDGTLWGWGSNVFGQIGDGVSSVHYLPAPVLLPCRFTAMPSRDHRAPGTPVCQEAR